MKLLVTGGCGFIGSNFIHYILKKYPTYKIVNFDKLTYAGNPANLKDLGNNPNYLFVQGDICDPSTVNKAMEKVDHVVHFAAESHVDRSMTETRLSPLTKITNKHIFIGNKVKMEGSHVHSI